VFQLEGEGGLDVEIDPSVDGVLRRGDGERCVLGDLLPGGQRDLEETPLGGEALDESDGEGLGGVDASAGEDEVLGAALPDEPG
jgi:hypothetical protein